MKYIKKESIEHRDKLEKILNNSKSKVAWKKNLICGGLHIKMDNNKEWKADAEGIWHLGHVGNWARVIILPAKQDPKI